MDGNAARKKDTAVKLMSSASQSRAQALGKHRLTDAQSCSAVDTAVARILEHVSLSFKSAKKRQRMGSMGDSIGR